MGKVIADRFELDDEVISGGMASVHRARDLTTGEPVAVKLLRSESCGAPRFEREARILAQLEHPRIVRYVAHGVAACGTPYLAMDWLEGEDLSRLLTRERQLPVSDALELIRRAAQALAVAHERDVVHRDIKPSNLFLVRGRIDQVTLLDFGVARALHDDFTTTAGSLVGTPAYMAPEQARGEELVTASADVFALGCVLYECLTGQPLFSGKHVMAVLTKILVGHTPSVRRITPEVPRRVDELLARMLSRHAEDRPRDAAALLDDLASLERGNGALEPASVIRRNPVAPEQSLLCVLMVGAAPSYPASGAMASADRAWELRSVAVRHDGRVEVLRDGTAVVLFEAEAAAMDLATQAAGCALLLAPLFPGTSIAIATGLGYSAADLPYGEAVDRAAALLQVQGSGANDNAAAIHLDAVTAGLIDARFDVIRDGKGPATLAGLKREPSSARTLLGKVTPFVGREREIGNLEGLLLECVNDSVARAAIITAGPGFGKSRLWQELFKRRPGPKDGFRLLCAWGDPTRSGSRFGVVRQILRRALRIADGEAATTAREKLRAGVHRHTLPEQQTRVLEFLGELLDLPLPDHDRPQLKAARRDPRLMGEQITRAWEEWIAAECSQKPVVLVLDDLHWADASSLELIDAALRSAVALPLLVLALGRREVHERFPALWKDRLTEQVHLSGLSDRACQALARAVLPGDTDQAVISRIVERSAGNAFFLEELLRAEAECHDEELPGTILAVLQARLARLPMAHRHLLRAASVLGQSFWPDALTPIADALGLEPCAVEQLEQLVERDWLTLARSSRFVGRPEFGFRHALMRDAAYTLLTDEERQLGHLATAAWLESAGEHDAAVLAQHWELGGNRVRASECFQRAARESFDANDMSTALSHGDRAIACGASGLTLAEVRLVQTKVHNWRGEHGAARTLGEEAIRLFEACAAGSLRTDRWADAVQHVTWACYRVGESDEVERLASQLLPRVQSHATPGIALALAYTALNLVGVGRMRLAGELLQHVGRVADGVVDDPAAGAALDLARGMYALATSNIADALHCYERAATRAVHAGGDRLLMETNLSVAWVREIIGDYGVAARSCQVAREAEARLRVQCPSNWATYALVHLRLGRAEEAEALLRDGIRVSSEQQDRVGECYCRICLARLLLERGDPAAAEAEALTALAVSENFPSGQAYGGAVLAAARLAQGRALEAEDTAGRACEVLDQRGVIDGEAFIRLVRAETLLANGRTERAQHVLKLAARKLRECASRIDDPELGHKFLARVPENARLLELASTCGEPEERAEETGQ